MRRATRSLRETPPDLSHLYVWGVFKDQKGAFYANKYIKGQTYPSMVQGDLDQTSAEEEADAMNAKKAESIVEALLSEVSSAELKSFLAARALLAMEDGDTAGFRAFQKALQKVAGTGWQSAMRTLGDPGNPAERAAVYARARAIVNQTDMTVISRAVELTK